MKGLEKANAGVERISDNRPSSERSDKEPDFLSASFASTLAKGGVAPCEQFEKLGVPTYISPADCIGKDNSGGGEALDPASRWTASTPKSANWPRCSASPSAATPWWRSSGSGGEGHRRHRRL
ncbi:hypothetical protein SMICM304S_09932 [Streptomyces microflavus]